MQRGLQSVDLIRGREYIKPGKTNIMMMPLYAVVSLFGGSKARFLPPCLMWLTRYSTLSQMQHSKSIYCNFVYNNNVRVNILASPVNKKCGLFYNLCFLASGVSELSLIYEFGSSVCVFILHFSWQSSICIFNVAGKYRSGYTPKARLLSDLFNRAPKVRGE